MDKFTPGPWYLDNAVYVVRPGLLPDGTYPRESIAALYGWTPEDPSVAYANGKLIAAAPDLFAACIMARAVHRESCSTPNCAAEQELTAAINKARGV